MPFTFDPSMFKRFAGRTRTLESMARDVAEEAASAFATTAERVMREAFIAASTPTGQARVAAGGNGPGRVDTERLINAISSALEAGGLQVVGRAGFLNDQQPYFLIQDQSDLYGAHAMQAAFIAGREAAIQVIVSRWSSR